MCEQTFRTIVLRRLSAFSKVYTIETFGVQKFNLFFSFNTPRYTFRSGVLLTSVLSALWSRNTVCVCADMLSRVYCVALVPYRAMSACFKVYTVNEYDTLKLFGP